MEALKLGAKFAKEIGVKDIVTHVGFIPENPSTTEYLETVTTIKHVALEAQNLEYILILRQVRNTYYFIENYRRCWFR